MYAPLRVLVVDDSVVFRKVVSNLVASESGLELVGTAANGSICMQKVQQLNPDVITLDLEMPVMDGFAVLRELQRSYPQIRVVVFSAGTARGAAQTFEAMRLGAADFLAKGQCVGGQENSIQHMKDELIPKILQFAKFERARADSSATLPGFSAFKESAHLPGIAQASEPSGLGKPPDAVKSSGILRPRVSGLYNPTDSVTAPAASFELKVNESTKPPKAQPTAQAKPPDSARLTVTSHEFRMSRLAKPADKTQWVTRNVPREIIAVGVSTGGPNALGTFLSMLPKSLPVPIVIVQHMPPLFTRLLAERLNATCSIAVKEAQEGMCVEPGTAYIAPGDRHLALKRQGLQIIVTLRQSPPENSCRPAVDVLFRSVADIYGAATVAVMLTGMGKDGFAGTLELKQKGAFVIAQDKATSVVWGMPGFVVEAGLANVVAPIDHVATEVARCLIQSTVRRT